MSQSTATLALAVAAFAIAFGSTAGGEAGSPTVQSLHAQLISPASDALFHAESQPPATSAEWQGIAAKAAELIRAAKQLESLESAKGQTQWQQFAQALGRAAEHASRAAQDQDQDALVIANGDIVSVCEDCHTKYRDSGRSMKD